MSTSTGLENQRASGFKFVRYVPNILTSARILLAVAFPTVRASRRGSILGAALATEYLDGAISRRFHCQSKTGQVLDPIADKLFFSSVAATLLNEGRVRGADILLLGIRDMAVIIAGAGLLVRRKWPRLSETRPLAFGKITTGLQYAALFSSLFCARATRRITWLTAMFGTLAVAQYYSAAIRSPAFQPLVNRAMPQVSEA